MGRRHYLAIGIFAGATIFCQIALTRLFSVVQYYHGAFLAISLALFGFALSGVFVVSRPERFARERLDEALARYGLGFALAIPVSFYTYLYGGLDALVRGSGAPGLLAAGAEYLLLALPFFASGVCISLLLLHGAARSDRLYATDLICSALGAVAVIPALAALGGPKSMLAASAAVACATLPFCRATRATRCLAPLAAAGAVAAMLWVPARAFDGWHMRKSDLVVATEQIRWNAFSMVGVGPEEAEPRSRSIIIDNSVSTVMMGSRGGGFEDVGYLRFDFAAPAYQLKPGGRALVIGSGGGRDVLVALLNGASHVRAVEVNPLVYETAAELYGDFTGHVYRAPRVQPVVGDARSYVANSRERFDVILASLIDTWAASSAGAFALTENLLYTTDAFRDYHDHLSDDGVLSISRWHPFETPRLLATAFAAWRAAGADDPRQHAVLIRSPPVGFGKEVATLLMKKSPFTPAEVSRIAAFCARARLSVVLTPTRVADDHVAAHLGGAVPVEWNGIDLSPATDERPFFFNMVRPSTQLLRMLGLQEPSPFEATTFEGNLNATRVLIQLFVAVVGLLALTVAVPLIALGGRVRRPHWKKTLVYFACLGLGFILIELGLLQRLILLLGKPVYALAVILSTMLLASGTGSFVSGRFAPERLAQRLGGALLALAALLAAYAWFLPDVLGALLGRPWLVRLAAAIALVAVPSFLLGMPFPSGLRALERAGASALVPWVWGVNGTLSVLASVGGIILAIEFGYTALFLVGAACYALAGVLLPRWASAIR